MSLISLVIVLVVVGFLLYLAETYIPMSEPFKMVIRVVVIIALLLWLLQLFGVVGPTIGRVG